MLTIAINKFMQKKLPMEIKAINNKGTQPLLLFNIGPVSLFAPSII
jgi:hypothetical protein